ncbi:MAG: DUF3298 domain-containing protein [Clostridiales bacterium]|nr:DUF3298 domain-containing protein [Clostridiales bacterium]
MENRKDDLQQMLKEKYEEVKVPKEAKERMKMGMEQAKEENKKNKKVVYFRRAGLGVAAACLGVVALANVSAGTSYALQKIPVIGSIAKVVTFRDYTDSTKNFEASVEVPQIKDTAENAKELEKTNKTIQEYADEFISRYENDLKETEGVGNYELKSTYQVIREDEQELVLEIDTIVVMASGAEYKKVFNIDKNTGKIKMLADYFKEDSNYIDVLTKEIKRQMREQMKADEEKIYFLDSDDGLDEMDFKKLSEDADFYFDTDGNLVVLFDEYEVAPGYMGLVSFTINRSVFESLLS